MGEPPTPHVVGNVYHDFFSPPQLKTSLKSAESSGDSLAPATEEELVQSGKVVRLPGPAKSTS